MGSICLTCLSDFTSCTFLSLARAASLTLCVRLALLTLLAVFPAFVLLAATASLTPCARLALLTILPLLLVLISKTQ